MSIIILSPFSCSPFVHDITATTYKQKEQQVQAAAVVQQKKKQPALPPLPALRETVAQIEMESKRLAVIAYTRPKGMRPSDVSKYYYYPL